MQLDVGDLTLCREIEGLKEMYERRLADENAEKVKLRGQAGIFRQRYEDAKEQAEQLRESARTKEERAARLKAVRSPANSWDQPVMHCSCQEELSRPWQRAIGRLA